MDEDCQACPGKSSLYRGDVVTQERGAMQANPEDESRAEVLFGGVANGLRTVVVNGITMHIPEDQIQALLLGADNSPGSTLSVMPDGQPCVTWVPSGQVKFTLSVEDLEKAQRNLKARDKPAPSG